MLIVALDASRKEPLYEQIYNSIKEEIVTENVNKVIQMIKSHIK